MTATTAAPGPGEVPPPRAYPLTISGTLDAGTGRWLWLVKWLLLVPHFVLLAFLWSAFVVTTLMAFAAILVRGRYPRSLFDFNVGVLRWTWRVMFYGYGVLGTDRYPPFSLHDVPDYPAHLHVDPPDVLSRGLVLVKWWLLAIPHHLVLAVLLGGGWYAATDPPSGPIGLVPLLVLIAAIALLFTGCYPLRLFDLVMGLNRWVFRVWAYCALMTDRYPPLALDQGGQTPAPQATGGPASTEPPATPRTVAPPHRPAVTSAHTGWTGGRVTSLVAGAALVMSGLGIAGIAGTVAWVDSYARDDSGFITTRETSLDSSGAAITSGRLDLRTDAPGRFLPERILGTVRIRAHTSSGRRLFLGVGPTDDVGSYLAGVDHDTVRGMHGRHMTYRHRNGSRAASPPIRQGFWVASSSGTGETQLSWRPESGAWTFVLMNAGGSRGVRSDVTVGAEFPVLDDAAAALALLALLLLTAGALLVAVPLRLVVSRDDA